MTKQRADGDASGRNSWLFPVLWNNERSTPSHGDITGSARILFMPFTWPVQDLLCRCRARLFHPAGDIVVIFLFQVQLFVMNTKPSLSISIN
jgi:hypothetical protein